MESQDLESAQRASGIVPVCSWRTENQESQWCSSSPKAGWLKAQEEPALQPGLKEVPCWCPNLKAVEQEEFPLTHRKVSLFVLSLSLSFLLLFKYSCLHFPPPLPQKPAVSISHVQSYPSLALSTCPLYMFLDNPSPFSLCSLKAFSWLSRTTYIRESNLLYSALDSNVNHIRKRPYTIKSDQCLGTPSSSQLCIMFS